ncbi:hypothetical protein [Rhodovastum atsumiense]|uniref:hypothetical protein n=1 Tax=Rhodovastum atsumiense TaxID=504468 RepID=UPI00139F2CE4|nr:hypothetical protein [Rhodovastum atsumiense]
MPIRSEKRFWLAWGEATSITAEAPDEKSGKSEKDFLFIGSESSHPIDDTAIII